jgi:hypothetical protein
MAFMNIPVNSFTGLTRLQTERDRVQLCFCPKRRIATKKVGPSTPERRQLVIRNPWHSSLQLSFLLPKTPSPRSLIGSLAEHGRKRVTSKTIIDWRRGVLFRNFALLWKKIGSGDCAFRWLSEIIRKWNSHEKSGSTGPGGMYRVRAYRDSEPPRMTQL